MSNVIHLATVTASPPPVATTTASYLAVEASPEAAVRLRLAVDDPVVAEPGDEVALHLTGTQAEDLMNALAWQLGRRCWKPLPTDPPRPPCSDS